MSLNEHSSAPSTIPLQSTADENNTIVLDSSMIGSSDSTVVPKLYVPQPIRVRGHQKSIISLDSIFGTEASKNSGNNVENGESSSNNSNNNQQHQQELDSNSAQQLEQIITKSKHLTLSDDDRTKSTNVVVDSHQHNHPDFCNVYSNYHHHFGGHRSSNSNSFHLRSHSRSLSQQLAAAYTDVIPFPALVSSSSSSGEQYSSNQGKRSSLNSEKGHSTSGSIASGSNSRRGTAASRKSSLLEHWDYQNVKISGQNMIGETDVSFLMPSWSNNKSLMSKPASSSNQHAYMDNGHHLQQQGLPQSSDNRFMENNNAIHQQQLNHNHNHNQQNRNNGNMMQNENDANQQRMHMHNVVNDNMDPRVKEYMDTYGRSNHQQNDELFGNEPGKMVPSFQFPGNNNNNNQEDSFSQIHPHHPSQHPSHYNSQFINNNSNPRPNLHVKTSSLSSFLSFNNNNALANNSENQSNDDYMMGTEEEATFQPIHIYSPSNEAVEEIFQIMKHGSNNNGMINDQEYFNYSSFEFDRHTNNTFTFEHQQQAILSSSNNCNKQGDDDEMDLSGTGSDDTNSRWNNNNQMMNLQQHHQQRMAAMNPVWNNNNNNNGDMPVSPISRNVTRNPIIFNESFNRFGNPNLDQQNFQ